MGITEQSRPSRLSHGRPLTSFRLFPKLPPEIRIRIYREVALVERILRLDLGVDTPPALLHTYESRIEVQKHYTTHQGKIYCDGSEDGTVATPEAFYRIWINKNGRDILHVTPMERPSFAATRGFQLDAFDLATRWAPSFALNNILAVDTLLWVRPEGGRPFANLTRLMLESGKDQCGMPNRPDDHDGARNRQISAWEFIYERLALSDLNAPDVNFERLGIKNPEMLVVWRDRVFDAARVDGSTLEGKNVRGSAFVPKGVELSAKEHFALEHIESAVNEVAWNWRQANESDPEETEEPIWPDVLLLKEKT